MFLLYPFVKIMIHSPVMSSSIQFPLVDGYLGICTISIHFHTHYCAQLGIFIIFPRLDSQKNSNRRGPFLDSGERCSGAFLRPNFVVAQAFFEHSVMVKEYTVHRRARDLFQLTTQSCEFQFLHFRSGFAVRNAVPHQIL